MTVWESGTSDARKGSVPMRDSPFGHRPEAERPARWMPPGNDCGWCRTERATEEKTSRGGPAMIKDDTLA